MLTRDNKMRRIEDRTEFIESVLAQETTLRVNLSSTYGNGDIESGGRVKIEQRGSVRGKIKASDVIVNGVLEGNIETTGQIELGHESRMIGNIKAAKIAIADGCFFQGEIKMLSEDDRPVRFVEQRTPKPTD
jgi:cytoskeletal protein CcmA (bactofilin family)